MTFRLIFIQWNYIGIIQWIIKNIFRFKIIKGMDWSVNHGIVIYYKRCFRGDNTCVLFECWRIVLILYLRRRNFHEISKIQIKVPVNSPKVLFCEFHWICLQIKNLMVEVLLSDACIFCNLYKCCIIISGWDEYPQFNVESPR